MVDIEYIFVEWINGKISSHIPIPWQTIVNIGLCFLFIELKKILYYAVYEIFILLCSTHHCSIQVIQLLRTTFFFLQSCVIFHHFGLMYLRPFCPSSACLRFRRAVCLGQQQAWATGFPGRFPSCAPENRSTLFSEWKGHCCLEWVDTPGCSDR